MCVCDDVEEACASQVLPIHGDWRSLLWTSFATGRSNEEGLCQAATT